MESKHTTEGVTRVRARDVYLRKLEFDTGEMRVFDGRPCLEKSLYTRLKDPAAFKQAFVAYDTECWPGNLDIVPERFMTVRGPRDESHKRFQRHPTRQHPAQADERGAAERDGVDGEDGDARGAGGGVLGFSGQSLKGEP